MGYDLRKQPSVVHTSELNHKPCKNELIDNIFCRLLAVICLDHPSDLQYTSYVPFYPCHHPEVARNEELVLHSPYKALSRPDAIPGLMI